MSSQADAQARIDGLIALGLRMGLSTATGRIVLAKVAENVYPSWIPDPLRDSVGGALTRATASAPAPLAFAEVERILTAAWGVKRPTDELDALDPEPVASTFTSQVHRGVHAGSAVAVKVLRPGVVSSLRQDLAIFEMLMAPLGGVIPGLDLSALLAEVRERGLDEYDLEHEAAHMRRFSRALRDGPVVAPSPVTDLCRETVLVCSWLDGEPVAGDVGFGHDATAAALLQFVIGGMREGLVHCDLDAHDVLILEDGRIGVVDFGAVVTIPRDRADLALAAVEAQVAGDGDALGSALAKLGLLKPGHGASALKVLNAALGELGGPMASQLDVASVLEASARLEGMEAEAAELAAAARCAPSDLYPARAVAQLFSLIARFGARGVWRDQVLAALRDGWRA